jgi:hypothetical protein
MATVKLWTDEEVAAIPAVKAVFRRSALAHVQVGQQKSRSFGSERC